MLVDLLILRRLIIVVDEISTVVCARNGVSCFLFPAVVWPRKCEAACMLSSSSAATATVSGLCAFPSLLFQFVELWVCVQARASSSVVHKRVEQLLLVLSQLNQEARVGVDGWAGVTKHVHGVITRNLQVMHQKGGNDRRASRNARHTMYKCSTSLCQRFSDSFIAGREVLR